MTSLVDLGAEQYVSLTTFRRTGQPVATPVWVAADPDGALVVTTDAGTGKVKRIRHTREVVLRPCSRTGVVPPGAPELRALAEVVADPDRIRALLVPLRRKYGLLARLMIATDALARGRQRVVLRLTTALGEAV